MIKCLMFFSFLALSSCANPVTKAVNKVKYSAYETVGIEKRDIFKKEVKNIKEDQDDTGEAFKDALTKLKEVYVFDGGNLEKEYNQLKDSYDEANEEASGVKKRIADLEQVAQDLFNEWESEIGEIKTKDLKAKSSKQLSQTRKKYQVLSKNLKKSEKSMGPVLDKLHDQVLFLKHNLNAKAIAGLKAESSSIQADIETLLKQMEKSSKEAESFIETL